MPRKRRQPKRRAALTLRGIGIYARLRLIVGWHPDEADMEPEKHRWTTYRELLDEYRDVRDEFLVRHGAGSFAEALYQRAEADPEADVEQLGETLYDEEPPDTEDGETDGPAA